MDAVVNVSSDSAPTACNDLTCTEPEHRVDTVAEVRLAFTNLVRLDSTNMRAVRSSESQIWEVADVRLPL
jgi:hypothetical protein